MNHKIVINVLGKVLVVGAIILLFPIIISLIYKENNIWCFLYPALGLLLVGGTCCFFVKPEDKSIYAKEGFVIVAFSWILLSLVGTLPFVLSKEIPNFIDALFETVSGFTTTGSSILTGEQVDGLSKSMQFHRIFTHFIGGMGVLVFVLAVLPTDNVGAMHLFRAESPGPSASKIVSKLKHTARILYGIYVLMTMVQIVLLIFGGIGVYDSILTAFATAGTGGFGVHGDSIAYYNSAYVEIVVAVFMFLFGINFNVYYLFLIGQTSKIFKSEEFKAYLIIVFGATVVIAINILSLTANFWQALRYSFFQVTSISSSTGFSTADFNTWPAFSKAILVVLMIVGASAGSTGGGMKVARFVILIKSCIIEVKRMIHPRSVYTMKLEGASVEKDVVKNVRTYFSLWFIIVISCTVLLCLDYNDLLTNLTATLACIGNIGPGLNAVGPMGNFGIYSPYSKILLSIVMLAGRLEIFPILILFSKSTWKK